MIQKLSSVCAKNIISLGKVHNINEAVLRYGCELILTSIIGLLIMVGLSMLIGHPLAWVFFVMGFAPLRTTAGGYHADSHIRCYTVTSVMFLMGVLTAYEIRWSHFTYLAVSLFAAIMVGFLAPVEAMNKPLSAKRYRLNRNRSLILIFINCAIAVIFAMLELVSEEANMYYAGIFFASTSLIIGKIKNSLKGGNSK